MEVEISRPGAAGAPTTTLHEPADVGRLSVRLTNVTTQEAEEALAAAGLGRLEGAHAWLTLDGLREAVRSGLAAGGDAEPDLAPFEGMVAYADRKGWLSADGSSVRAHVEAG